MVVALRDSEIDLPAAILLEALDRVHPIPDIQAGPEALGRWLIECGNDGLLGDDTVVWLHRMLLPNLNAARHVPPRSGSRHMTRRLSRRIALCIGAPTEVHFTPASPRLCSIGLFSR